MTYTNQEYCDMLMPLGECHGQYHVVVRRYVVVRRIVSKSSKTSVSSRHTSSSSETLRNWQCPGKQTRWGEIKNLRNTAVLLLWNKNLFSNGILNWVFGSLLENITCRATVYRILQEEKFRYTRVQHLQPTSKTKNILRIFSERNRSRSYIPFSCDIQRWIAIHEKVFSIRMHLWSDENPTATRFRSFQIRWKRNLWAGIMGTEILGPVVLPDILNDERYVELLRSLPDFLEEIIRQKQNSFSRQYWTTQHQNCNKLLE